MIGHSTIIYALALSLLLPHSLLVPSSNVPAFFRDEGDGVGGGILVPSHLVFSSFFPSGSIEKANNAIQRPSHWRTPIPLS